MANNQDRNNQNSGSNYNAKRSNIISSLKRKNLMLALRIKEESRFMVLSDSHFEHLGKLENNLIRCANLTLYKSDGSYNELVASHTCDHKACMICNYLRQKKIRRKYSIWFDKNSSFYRIIDEKGKIRIVTHWQLENKFAGSKEIGRVQYKIMFFTLTVPHTEKGFKGQLFYQKEIREAFKKLRREKEWNKLVYGGEFGIEITKGENGLHIHIHGLLFVKNIFGYRNQLHRVILYHWNRFTVDTESKRESFSDTDRKAIKKGNREITDTDIDLLNPKGSTFISLENIFVIKEGKRVYITKYGSKEMLWAVMEAISYHFEPQAFDKKSGEFDLRLLIDLLPSLFRLRIYDRFGILYKESPLAITDNSYALEFAEALKAKELAANEKGEVLKDSGQYDYFVVNPAYVYHIGKEKLNKKIIMSNKAKERQIDLSASNTGEAIEELSYMVDRMHKKGVNYN